MPEMTETQPRARSRLRVGVVIAALLMFLVGLFGMGLAPSWMVWLVGVAVVIVGATGAAFRARWGLVLLVLGAALLLGTAAYFVIGLIQPDGPACGGTGCVTGS